MLYLGNDVELKNFNHSIRNGESNAMQGMRDVCPCEQVLDLG